MSDGPHRSLSMRPGWKKVAEFAANPASAPEDINRHVIPALDQDWRTDVSDTLAGGICDVLRGQQDSLFGDQKIMQLEALRPMTAGHEFGRVLIDCAIQVASEGKLGPDAASEATARALGVWAARCARQVEEHYCRKSNLLRARNVRSRIEEGIHGASLGGLARQLLKLDPGPAQHAPSKQSELDDGVRL